MATILIRDLSAEAVRHIDRQAAAQGLSRNEYLRRRFEADAARKMTLDDLRRAAHATRDLLDPEVIRAAWK